MKFICRWLLSLRGWKIPDKPLPKVKKAILIFAPHTSNWDFVTMVMAKFALGVKVRYLGKHTLFYWPYGWFFRSLGGMPVVRHRHDNMVGQVVDLIDDNENIWLVLAPEGTRSYTPYWKSGFYHIASRSDLPIIMFYLDNKTRTIGHSEAMEVSGNIEQDMQIIADYYTQFEGYNPEQTSLIQTKKQYKLAENNNDKS